MEWNSMYYVLFTKPCMCVLYTCVCDKIDTENQRMECSFAERVCDFFVSTLCLCRMPLCIVLFFRYSHRVCVCARDTYMCIYCIQYTYGYMWLVHGNEWETTTTTTRHTAREWRWECRHAISFFVYATKGDFPFYCNNVSLVRCCRWLCFFLIELAFWKQNGVTKKKPV